MIGQPKISTSIPYPPRYQPIPPPDQTPQQLQADYCQRMGAPPFAPASGVCWHCHRSIYSSNDGEDGGYSKLYTMSAHITECPYCHYSFCE